MLHSGEVPSVGYLDYDMELARLLNVIIEVTEASDFPGSITPPRSRPESSPTHRY